VERLVACVAVNDRSAISKDETIQLNLTTALAFYHGNGFFMGSHTQPKIMKVVCKEDKLIATLNRCTGTFWPTLDGVLFYHVFARDAVNT